MLVSRKIARFSEKVKSADKYPTISIVSYQTKWGDCLFTFEINCRAFKTGKMAWNWKSKVLNNDNQCERENSSRM